MTINGENDQPVAVDDSGTSFATDQDTAFVTGNVLTNDSDIDATDVLNVSGIDLTGTVGSVTNNNDGTFTYDPNSQFDSLPQGQLANDSFAYQLSDGNGGTASAIVTVAVTGINDVPSASDDSFAVDENSVIGTAVGAVTASDIDLGDTLTYSIIAGNGSGAFAIDSGSGQITVSDDSPLDFETTPQFVLTVEVVDSLGAADVATITVDLNDLPEGGGPIQFINGDLVITGDGGDNTVTIINNNGTTTVTYAGLPPVTFPTGDILQIVAVLGDGDDTIQVTGFNVPVDIDGGAGDDNLDGSLGDDRLVGGPGNDILDGDAGNDVMIGGAGSDTITGGAGDDLIKGGSGSDSLFGGSGADVIRGGGGADSLFGGSGGDLLVGGGNTDSLNAGFGGDILIGGRSSASDANLVTILEEWTSGRSYNQANREHPLGRWADSWRSFFGPWSQRHR